ncbi:MAG TPA: allantoate amidohydrolase, partial [Modicisalibacter sp.]|nr:allantoate amidohydrolase [Modicisalibacter sp.]
RMLGHDILQRLDEAATCSQPGPGVTRTFCSDEHRQVLILIERWMQAAGLSTQRDAAGNLIGRSPRAQAGEPTLIIGSHQDTVTNGGKYDGMLGVVLPLAALEAMHRAGDELPYGIEVVAFGDEEGTRFQSTLVGSRALAGTFRSEMLDAEDAEGISMGQALQAFGGDPQRIATLARDPERTLGFFEVHIEQGPVLENRNLAVAAVTALTGIERHRLRVTGKAGHAGTTPMDVRQDALVAAARMVVAVDDHLQATPDLVGVIGKLAVRPNATNVIPATVEMTLELRSPQDALRRRGRETLIQQLHDIARHAGVSLDIEQTYEAQGVACADWMIEGLKAAMQRCQLTPHAMYSGAGHDGLAMHDLTDIGMLFVRCRDGLSHHPDESITAEDAETAARVLIEFLKGFPAEPRR